MRFPFLHVFTDTLSLVFLIITILKGVRSYLAVSLIRISVKWMLLHVCIYFWLCWVFVAPCGLSLVAASRGYLLRCEGFLLQWLLLLQSTGSRVHGLGSCSTWAQLLCGMWDLPGSGIEPVSPALAGGFFTTKPPGKPLRAFQREGERLLRMQSPQGENVTQGPVILSLPGDVGLFY